MKNYLLTFLLMAGFLTSLNAQTIQTPFKRSTLIWNQDMTMTDANLAVLQTAEINSKNNININLTAASNRTVDISNTKITCDQLVITSDVVKMSNVAIDCTTSTFVNTDIVLEGVTINCSNITFTNTVNAITALRVTKINSKKVVFAQPSGGISNFSIKNTGPAELSITGVLTKGRNLIFSQSDNFKITFQEN